jgi:hypothetical protein
MLETCGATEFKGRLVLGHRRVIRLSDSASFWPPTLDGVHKYSANHVRKKRGNQTPVTGIRIATIKARGAHLSRNVTVQPGFRFQMSGSGRPEQTEYEGDVTDARPACVALVPMVQPTEWTRTSQQPSRPASTFLTQLLATAEHAPQTRALRRATAADAQTAYSANRSQAGMAGIRTRQII